MGLAFAIKAVRIAEEPVILEEKFRSEHHMLKLAVVGATGRMGKEIIAVINAETDIILTEVLVRNNHALLGKRVCDFIKLNNSVYSLLCKWSGIQKEMIVILWCYFKLSGLVRKMTY